MFGLNRPRTAYRLDRQPAEQAIPATPLTIRLRHIDIELGKLSRQPRTVHVLVALDWWLDRRLALRPVNPGCGDIMIAGQGGQHCEICEQEIEPGEVIADLPGTGGLVQHVCCPGGAR